MSERKLLWSDEFEGPAGSGVNSNFWNFDLGDGTSAGIPGWGNQEREWYLAEQAALSGSSELVITAERNTSTTDYPAYYGEPAEWLSAKLTTKAKVEVLYGLIEARVKIPTGAGTWPAFWLLGSDISSNAWPNCGEIDIMETKGSEPYTVHGTAHGPGYSGGDGIVNTKTVSSRLGSGYHIYALDWTKNKMVWSIDGKAYHVVTPSIVGNHTYVFNKPMFMILNVAAGGWFAGDIDPDLNSAQMTVDYIRYYSINGQGRVTGSSSAIAAGKP